MSKMLPLKHVADLQVRPGDLVKIMKSEATMIKMTTGELQDLKEAIDLELGYREFDND